MLKRIRKKVLTHLPLINSGGVVIATFMVFTMGVVVINAQTFMTHVFYDERAFYQMPQEISVSPELIYGSGIVPHHIVASEMIHELLLNLPKDIKTIYLIGPNHTEEGITIQTSNVNWKTMFGNIEVDQDKVVSLIRNGSVANEPIRLASDQSVAALTDYIAYHLPNVKVVPIILKAGISLELMSGLVDELEFNAEGSFFLVSTDFSHYLEYENALKHDQVTYGVLKFGSVEDVRGMNSDFLDSDSAIMVLKMLNERLGLTYMRLLAHSTNYDITKSASDYTNITSYFTVLYSKMFNNENE